MSESNTTSNQTKETSGKKSFKYEKLFKDMFAVLFFWRKRNVSQVEQAKIQTELDKKLVYSLSKSKIPTLRQLKHINKFLSKKEKLLMKISLLVLAGSIGFLIINFYYKHLETVAIAGGEYTEAFVGSPKHINPLYASLSDVDSDISSLIFSSLFKRGKDGELVNDLTDSYEISKDNKEYTFHIRKDVKWQNGESLSADDIIFTFHAIVDEQYKSPLRASFIGVKIKKIDDYSFKFILTDSYAAFLQLLTFGILPANEWARILPENAALADLNLAPIGSGPYRLDKRLKDTKGGIHEYFLAINDEYYGQKPYLNFRCIFFPGFEEAIAALNDRKVDGISYLPDAFRKNIITPKAFNFYNLYFPQFKAIFFNQKSNPALGDKALRQALAYGIDRNEIINKDTGKAYLVDGPILPNNFAYWPDIKKYDYNVRKSAELLDSIDWKLTEVTEENISQAEERLQNEEEKKDEDVKKAEILKILGPGKWRQKDGEFLVINLTTVDSGENAKVIEDVKNYWQKLGIKTLTHVIPGNQIQGEVIKPRAFEALFYSLIVGADPDPYAFWHSSQAQKNGFNIADYENKEMDQLLEDARLTANKEERKKKYELFQKTISEEEPAIFMYSPLYTYVQDNKVKGFNIDSITIAADRFGNIADWYEKTGRKLIWNKGK